MMFFFNRKVQIETERLLLRPPAKRDFHEWAKLRYESRAFLKPWDPTWARDHLTRQSFARRVDWAQKAINDDAAYPMFLFQKSDGLLLGAITLDNVRRGPSQVGTIGYWMGEKFARQGFMQEALLGMVRFAFEQVNISRLESACLPENVASRGVLEKCGFKYEGVAQAYIQINGRWRTHVLYAQLRNDRRGKTDIGS
ncbi:MAG: GNAT family protein [Paracoccaceae bacterium]|jgi:ribosomal-protein-alanine N-acetyltransferase|nr:N-acetyltransferase [Paracoccaceae bacterium]NDH26749.1 N-acetyltransferase [Paracoccaceae bacterium]|tara:strand:+ start:671 stop:1261 length:591 start_codon:yes stop_codon:yes gene_type:complete